MLGTYVNECMPAHTDTETRQRGKHTHTQSFVSSNVGTYQTVPMEKKEVGEKERQTDLKSVARRGKIVQRTQKGTKLHLCFPQLQMQLVSAQKKS